MKLYSIKKGKHYFNGYKMQPAFLQYGLTLLSIFISIEFGSWWFIMLAVAIFTGFTSLLRSDIVFDSVRVCFSKNCTYKLTENFDQINKLYGFSEGFHHWNSARIGWRCVNGVDIELLAYCYLNGKRTSKQLLICKADEWVFCSIQNKNSKYVFRVIVNENQVITASVDKDKKFSIYSLFKLFIYRLYPYFGGKISAPHDMDIQLIKLKF